MGELQIKIILYLIAAFLIVFNDAVII